MSEQCDACGFDGGRYDDGALLDELRALGPRWVDLLGRAGDELRVRPGPEVWSAIEYAAHSRDVTSLHAFGVEQALSGTEPEFGAVGDDTLEEAARSYGDVDPGEVGAALAAAATRMADLADGAGPAAWRRGLTVSYARLDVRRLLEHALHDSLHHLDDVERGLSTLRDS